jgi:hypothetical protein
MRVVHAGCGGEVGTDRVCSCCGMVVGRDEEAWVRPWRSPDPIPLARPVPAQAEELQDQVQLAGQQGHPRVRDAAAGPASRSSGVCSGRVTMSQTRVPGASRPTWTGSGSPGRMPGEVGHRWCAARCAPSTS